MDNSIIANAKKNKEENSMNYYNDENTNGYTYEELAVLNKRLADTLADNDVDLSDDTLVKHYGEKILTDYDTEKAQVDKPKSDNIKTVDGYRSYSGREYTDNFICAYCKAENFLNGIYEKYLDGKTTCAECGKVQKIEDEK
jgi:hypothetical protein